MASSTDLLKLVLFLARPAAGKSEIIQYLDGLSSDERKEDYHLGTLRVIDDFPMLWTWFEEDELLTKMGKPRLHTSDDGYFIGNHMWDLLIEKISLGYEKILRDSPQGTRKNSEGDETVVIEFSRGSQHGGFRRAFEHLSKAILATCCVVYIDVSFEESLRKNRQRRNPERPDSIIEHSLPDEKMEKLYRKSDWNEFAGSGSGYLQVKGHAIPYVVFDNEDDATTGGGKELGQRIKQTMNSLNELMKTR